MEYNLKSCPFCNKEVSLINGASSFRIWCCFCRIDFRPGFYMYKEQEELIKWWNTRKGYPDAQL